MILKKFISRFFHGLTANVIIFGVVSFLTDVSTEMIYPLLPLFLTHTLGAGPAFLGLIEGIAESLCSFLKLYSGIQSDNARDRSKWVLFGYTLSSFSKPFIALAQGPWTVLLVRAADRTGKGLRTSPRDALLADSTHPQHHGRAFGFQRSMDNAGAAVGPLFAWLLLTYYTQDLRVIFWIAAIPGILAVLLILFKVREIKTSSTRMLKKFNWSIPRGKLGAYLGILFIFTLSASSDAFLLLYAEECGVPRAHIPLIWMVLHIIKTLTIMPFGILSDRIGRGRIILYGWFIYALVFVLFGFSSTPLHIWILFMVFGLFSGCTEGTERAFLVDIAPAGERGQAFGWFNFVIGLAALPASLLFGIIWKLSSAQTAFFTAASIAFAAAILFSAFLFLTRPSKKSQHA
ncbi:MAG TPA: MFS transporter [Candidatus Omnitrophota bacterium]|nr:MFS transporter [Candidatus Omnitrophota bacterium]